MIVYLKIKNTYIYVLKCFYNWFCLSLISLIHPITQFLSTQAYFEYDWIAAFHSGLGFLDRLPVEVKKSDG